MAVRFWVQIGAALTLALAGLGPFGTAARAGVDGTDNDSDSPSFSSANEEGSVSFSVANTSATAHVTSLIQDAYAICSNQPQKEYTVDCLGERLQVLAKSMPNTGDYAPAKKVLAETSKKLRKLARDNKSTTKPRARLRNSVRGKTVTTSAVTPVRTEAVASTIRQAAVIMKEAETMLLRSSANSDRRKVHYAQMAQAVGSNKILLRAI